MGMDPSRMPDELAHAVGPEHPALTHVAGTLEAAVAWAATQAAAAAGGPSPISAVVLSPASASWDQFPNYEVRGDRFAALSREVTAAK